MKFYTALGHKLRFSDRRQYNSIPTNGKPLPTDMLELEIGRSILIAAGQYNEDLIINGSSLKIELVALGGVILGNGNFPPTTSITWNLDASNTNFGNPVVLPSLSFKSLWDIDRGNTGLNPGADSITNRFLISSDITINLDFAKFFKNFAIFEKINLKK